MNALSANHGNYLVEEISHEEMVTIIENQQDAMINTYRQNDAEHNNHESLSKRLSKIANQQLPDWLINTHTK